MGQTRHFSRCPRLVRFAPNTHRDSDPKAETPAEDRRVAGEHRNWAGDERELEFGAAVVEEPETLNRYRHLLDALPLGCVFDGEICALDQDGSCWNGDLTPARHWSNMKFG